MVEICKICDEVKANKAWLTRHMNSEHGIIKCQKCSMEFKEKEKFEKHMREKHPIVPKNVKCNECDKYFTDKGIQYHYNASHAKNQCPECDKIFDFESKLSNHITEYHPDYRYKCDICAKEFEKLRNYRDHYKHMHEEINKELQCDLCDYKTVNKKYLAGHIRKMHEKSTKTHPCKVCKKVFQSKQYLRTHELAVHNFEPDEKDKIYSCSICNFKSYYSFSLKGHHQAKHSGQKNHACDICGKLFSMPNDLKKHKKHIHTDFRPYKCEFCEKDFYSKSNYYKHMKNKHIDNEYEACQFCGVLRKKCSMADHVRAFHEQDIEKRKSMCKICGANIVSLKRHMRMIHDIKEAKIECQICQKKFKTETCLRKHNKYVHAEGKFKCEICQKKCKQEKDLKVHLDSHQVKETKCNICQKEYKCLKSHIYLSHQRENKSDPEKCLFRKISNEHSNPKVLLREQSQLKITMNFMILKLYT